MEKRLNLGTIVKLKEDENVVLMIVGYMMQNGNSYTDYAAIVYPYGISTLEDVIYINHEDISEMVFDGYTNEMTARYHELLDEFENKNPKKGE